MGKYVFEYYAGSDGAEAGSEASNAAWGAWFGQLSSKLIDAGNPFAPGGKAVQKSGVTTIENHPATGYSIVEADSLDAAAALAQGCPLLADSDEAAVRVYEALPM